MPKNIQDIVLEENVNHNRFQNVYNSYHGGYCGNYCDDYYSIPQQIVPTKYPTGLKVGDFAYIYSVGMSAWLWAEIVIVDDTKQYDKVAFKSVEHADPKGYYFTNKVRYVIDNEIIESRARYFAKNPQRQVRTDKQTILQKITNISKK